MSVSTHLAVSPAQYDARIRSLIPLDDELIAEVARALDHAARPVRIVVDLGIGTVDMPWRRSPFAVIVGCRRT